MDGLPQGAGRLLADVGERLGQLVLAQLLRLPGVMQADFRHQIQHIQQGLGKGVLLLARHHGLQARQAFLDQQLIVDKGPCHPVEGEARAHIAREGIAGQVFADSVGIGRLHVGGGVFLFPVSHHVQNGLGFLRVAGCLAQRFLKDILPVKIAHAMRLAIQRDVRRKAHAPVFHHQGAAGKRVRGLYRGAQEGVHHPQAGGLAAGDGLARTGLVHPGKFFFETEIHHLLCLRLTVLGIRGYTG